MQAVRTFPSGLAADDHLGAWSQNHLSGARNDLGAACAIEEAALLRDGFEFLFGSVEKRCVGDRQRQLDRLVQRDVVAHRELHQGSHRADEVSGKSS